MTWSSCLHPEAGTDAEAFLPSLIWPWYPLPNLDDVDSTPSLLWILPQADYPKYCNFSNLSSKLPQTLPNCNSPAPAYWWAIYYFLVISQMCFLLFLFVFFIVGEESLIVPAIGSADFTALLTHFFLKPIHWARVMRQHSGNSLFPQMVRLSGCDDLCQLSSSSGWPLMLQYIPDHKAVFVRNWCIPSIWGLPGLSKFHT